MFQSTRPQGARRKRSKYEFYFCFNPRARRGRDAASMTVIYRSKAVSIHAPAGGATLPRHRNRRSADVSIHAPAGGATDCSGKGGGECMFQSTRPQGARRTSELGDAVASVFQSTRPQGARPCNTRCFTRGNKFQSTRPQGARPSLDVAPAASVNPEFQSTRPQGARLMQLLMEQVPVGFNPRARRGRDCIHVISGISWC